MKLYNTFKSLILEIASVDSIVDAIKKRDKIIIYYDGDEPGGRGLRLIEPVCFGYSKADNPVVRAWDSQGASHTAYLGEQPLPGWRLFRADKIFSFKPTGETFNEPKPNYNPNGDKSMNRVIINADFSQVTLQQEPEPTTPETELEVNDVIDDVIITTVNDMINDIIEKDGADSLEGVDLSKAAESYKRIYAGIEDKIRRNLSNQEKNDLRPKVSELIQQSQSLIKK
jgi:predicted DNA-binding transcriptional regulator YafY